MAALAAELLRGLEQFDSQAVILVACRCNDDSRGFERVGGAPEIAIRREDLE